MSSRHGLEIRAATLADAPGVAELLAASGHPIAAPAIATRLDRLRGAPCAVLLALEWGPPSGIIAVHWHVGLTADHPMAEIELLLVGPDERRRGLARLLLKAASQAARSAGCHDIRLPVASGQAELLAFGTATGFTPEGAQLRRPLRRGGQQAGT